MGFIYKITNSINDKLYIGQTTGTIQHRWASHVWSANRKNKYSKIARAIKKYGKENFKISVIEEVPDYKLNEREMFWIDYYDTCNTGYNITVGGDGRILVSDKNILNAWNKGLIIKDVADLVGINRASVSDRLKALGISEEEIQSRRYKKLSDVESDPVYQYDLDGNFVAEYKTKQELQDKFGKNVSVTKELISKHHSLHGYQWRKYKADRIEPYDPWMQPNVKEVNQYDLNLNFIKSYKSVAQAAKENNIDHSCISAVAKGRRKTTHGYIWRYKYQDNNALKAEQSAV